MSVNTAAAVGKVLGIQSALLLALFLGAGTLFGWPVARSVGLGGLVAFLPNVYFALRIAGNKKKTPRQIVRHFYRGEVVKLALTAALFFLVLQMPDIRFLPLFAGFVTVLGGFWFALLTD